MKRRDFLKTMGAVGLTGSLPIMSEVANAAPGDPVLHSGKILINFQLSGGWDHSSFADPRENPAVNHWADNSPAGTAGELRFAPMADNESFFTKYYDRMLVVNGLDLQSNGHDATRRNRNTGSLMVGKPSLSELYAAIVAPSIPMPFLREGGFSETVGIMPFTALPDESLLRTLANPNFYNNSRYPTYYATEHMDVIKRYRHERLEALQARPDNLPRWQHKLNELMQARTGTSEISILEDALPETLDSTDLAGDARGDVRKMHLFLVMAAAGLTATISFDTGGWDTHSNHDQRHANALTNMTRIIDYTWAKAESLGIADRIVMHITSDVGRTPRYNANNGKDHWSAGGDIVMMKNAPWANRIVGKTGPTHNKVRIDPVTLKPAEGGIMLKPKHLQNELRKLLGIADHPLAKKYDLDAEAVSIFDPSVATGIEV